ncbi:MAG TPA: hypothetical protein VEQ17_05790 [Steroidobacteraceae bacterium]|nr:hypothetical protein [Steroidobacteraceae bacterium]
MISRSGIFCGLLLPVLGLAAAAPDAQLRNFVACPIVRDTASVPCWLTEYQGELYFLTLQSDVSAPVNPPWLGHRVLVEGRRSDKPRICGGIVLDPVRLSVIAEPDASCNTMLPAEDRYNLTFEPPRPPGPSGGKLAFNTLPMPAAAAEVKREPKSYTMTYDFNGMVNFKTPFQLAPVLELAKAMPASRIEITGHRGVALLSDGTVLQEKADLAQRRAEQIAELLRGAGLTAPAYTVRWTDTSPPPDGVEDYRQRRVDITVLP